MNTFSRLSSVSAKDIQFVRDKLEASEVGSILTDHRYRKSSARPSYPTIFDEDSKPPTPTSTYDGFCGLGDKVVVMAPIFGFFGKVDTKVWYSLLLLIMLITHIVVGAVVFNKLETSKSAKLVKDDRVYQKMYLTYFLTEHGFLRPDNKTYDRLTLKELDVMLELYKSRCFKTDNVNTDANMWNFWTSMDFASTIVTTIGYGGMAPRTETGKLFVIVYTIPGMLLMMSYLNIFSTAILLILRAIIKLARVLTRSSRLPDLVEQGIVLVVTLCFLFAYLITMSFLMHLSNPENDTLLKSFYFYVITMTTVGFGDIALINYTWVTLVRVLFVFCIGLVMVSLVFNAIRELAAAYQRRVVEVSQKIAMRTLAVAKQHRLKTNNAIKNGTDDQRLVVVESDKE